MWSYLVAAVVLFLITTTVIIFLRLSLISLGILLIAIAGSMACSGIGYWWLTGPEPELVTPGAILAAGGVGSLAICSITATLIFSKSKAK